MQPAWRCEAGEKIAIRLTLNGKAVSTVAEPRMQLADLLRDVLGAFGTHVGCEHGLCGACTVLLDGRAVRSCMIFAPQVDGCEVRTVEGLARPNGALSELQSAFARHHAAQCGFCTPGILMSAVQFLAEVPVPSADDVRDMLSGHLCRCTGYQGIVDAILDAAQTMPPSSSENTDFTIPTESSAQTHQRLNHISTRRRAARSPSRSLDQSR
jgi:2-furoyl-CoA dehydrogenase 2Fe-2S iron sulfur subunit